MSHGEQWIVPLNYFLLASGAVVWIFGVPWIATLMVFLPVAVPLYLIAHDKYGGMFITQLVAPNLLIAGLFILRMIKRLESSGRTAGVLDYLGWGYGCTVSGSLLFASPFIIGGCIVGSVMWLAERRNRKL